MRVRDTLLAGVAGSLAMAAAVRLFPRLSQLERDLDHLMAAQLTREPERLEEAVSLALGILFAPAYVALWEAGVGQAGARDGLVFGALHGGAIVLSKPLMDRLNGSKLDLPRCRTWVTGEVLEHALYGLVVGATYKALRRNL